MCDDSVFPPNCNEVFDTGIDLLRTDGFSNYNSLQVRLEKNFSHGLQFEASYTYAHALDDASSAALGSLNNGDFRDQRYPFLEYGNSDFDVRHRFVISYIYQLPFRERKKLRRQCDGPEKSNHRELAVRRNHHRFDGKLVHGYRRGDQFFHQRRRRRRGFY